MTNRRPKELYVVQLIYTGPPDVSGDKYTDWQTISKPMTKGRATNLARYQKFAWNRSEEPLFQVWNTRIAPAAEFSKTMDP
jgi:hypothetical protein